MVRGILLAAMCVMALAQTASAAEQSVRFVGNGFFPMNVYVHNGTQLRIYNRHTQTATITIGSAVVTLQPGQDKLFNYAQWSTGANLLPMIAVTNGVTVNGSTLRVDVGAPIWAKKGS